MKKIFLLLTIISTAFATAQSTAIPPEQATAKDIAAFKVKEMDKMLNLTDEQEKKLMALYLNQKMVVRKTKSVQELQSKQAAITAKLKAILTPKQFKKLTTNAKLSNKKELTERPQ